MNIGQKRRALLKAIHWKPSSPSALTLAAMNVIFGFSEDSERGLGLGSDHLLVHCTRPQEKEGSGGFAAG